MISTTIDQVEIYVLKIDRHYRIGGHEDSPGRLPASDYYFESQWQQVYSSKTESCLVKVTCADGTAGWGEAQAPITPETAGTLVRTLLGPAILGCNALAHEVIYDRLYNLMAARGQQHGFFLDAVAAIDIALWDIRGKVLRAPACALLGGPFRELLPAYVSGLRRPSGDERCAVAQQGVQHGFTGVKIFSGAPVPEAAAELEAVREAIGPGAFLGLDAIHAYGVTDALRIGQTLDRLNADWFEAPVGPDHIEGHVRLANTLSVSIVGGETLRSAAEFLPWIQAGALRVLQPDAVRCGITAAKRIADLGQAFQLDTALHLGVCTGVGVAATWQLAAALPRFVLQEHQLDLFETANRILRTPLREEKGKLVVPMAPGLGVEVDENAVRELATDHWIVRTDS
jgi:D-galactarolactone cycloisomerase